MIMEEKREIFPLELIKTGVLFLKNTRTIPEYKYDPTRSLLVYNLLELEDNFLPLNREYKPLGLSGYEPYAVYENYDYLIIRKKYVNIELLSKSSDLANKYFFFSDITYPRNQKNKDRYIDLVKKVFNI